MNKETFSTVLNGWSAAIAANDADEIAKYMSEDWVIVDRTGVFPREGFLGAVRSGALTHDAMAHEVHSVRVYGDLAVVISRNRNTGAFQGQPFSNDEWVSDIFRRQGDAWVCLHTHLTPAK